MTAGCGRFGFEALSTSHEGARPAAEGDVQDATAADAGATAPGSVLDGAVDGSARGPGSAGNGYDAASTPDTDGGLNVSDAAPPTPDLEPLPTNVDCTSVTGLISCDSFSGSASGVPVSNVVYGGRGTLDDIYSAATRGDMEGAHVEARFNALSSGAVFFRFSVFIPSYYSIDGINLASLGDLDTGNDFGLDLNLVRDGQVEIKTSGDGAVSGAGSFMFPRDQWACVLIKVESIDDNTGAVKVLVNSDEIISATNVDTRAPGGITGASVGLDWTFHNQGPATLYVDNFVVARMHPGNCP